MLDIDKNPWLGLASYQASDAELFFGRNKEILSLTDAIKQNYCTVIYGKSGMGKTSLINAGLIPQLQTGNYFPVSIKLEHNTKYNYVDQIIDRIEEKLKELQCEKECIGDININISSESKLWLFFHTNIFWSKENCRILPVVFIDQFEEIFTLCENKSDIIYFFSLLNELFQPLPPEDALTLFEENNIRFDFNEATNFRIVLSMREDFLARLEDNAQNIPVLKKNRIGIAPMNGLQAMDVILKPYPGIVDREAALKIIEKVAKRNDIQDNDEILENLSLETCILSLFCNQLYKKAVNKKLDYISTNLIDEFGDNIISEYYKDCIKGISKESIIFLEDRLLTNSGFRNSLAYEDVVPQYVLAKEIDQLEKSRLIRKEIQNKTERIEFTHDVLCKEAIKNKTKRREKQNNKDLGNHYLYLFFELSIILSYIGILFQSDLNSSLHSNTLHAILTTALLIGGMLLRIVPIAKKQKSWIYSLTTAFLCNNIIPIYAIYFIVGKLNNESNYIVAWTILYGLLLIGWFISSFIKKRKTKFTELVKQTILPKNWDSTTRKFLLHVVPISIYLFLVVFAGIYMIEPLALILFSLLSPILFCVLSLRFTDILKNKQIRLIGSISTVLMIVLYFSQYIGFFTQYLTIIALLYITYKTILILFDTKKIKKQLLITLSSWFVIFILLPTIILGYNLWGLGNKTIVDFGTIDHNSTPDFIIVQNNEKKQGAIDRMANIIIPNKFNKVYNFALHKQNDDNNLTFYVDEKDLSIIDLLEYKNKYTTRYINNILKHNNDIISIIDEAANQHNHESDSTTVSNTSNLELYKISDKQEALYAINYNTQLNKAKLSKKNSQENYNFINKALQLAIANNLTSTFLSNANYNNDETSIKSVLINSIIYVKTGSIYPYYTDVFEEYLTSNTEYLSKIKTLFIDVTPESFGEKIIDKGIFNQEIIDIITNDRRFLSLRNKKFNKHINDIYERQKSDLIYSYSKTNHSFSLIFMGEYEAAKQLSLEAMAEPQKAEEDTFIYNQNRILASTNLLSSYVFLKEFDNAYQLLNQYNDTIVYNGAYKFYRDWIAEDFEVYEKMGITKEISQDEYLKFKNKIYCSPSYQTLQKTDYDVYWAGLNFDMLLFNNLSYTHALSFGLNKDGKMFLMDKKGNRLTETFDDVCVDLYSWDYTQQIISHKPIIIYSKENKRGYYNVANKEYITPARYEHAYFFSEGLAAVVENNKIGWIDQSGEIKIPYHYDYISGYDYIFHGDYARMYNRTTFSDGTYTDKVGLIDKSGKIVVPIKYDNISDEKDGLRIVRIGKKQGVIDNMGNELYWSDENEDIILDQGKYAIVDKYDSSLPKISFGEYTRSDGDFTLNFFNEEIHIYDENDIKIFDYKYAYINNNPYLIIYNDGKKLYGKLISITEHSFTIEIIDNGYPSDIGKKRVYLKNSPR